VPIFPDLSMQLKFYFADEEFPPSLTFLWDKNILDFVRYETVYYIAGVLRDRLMEALIATKGSVLEYDTAMRNWTQMTGWFAVEVADAALQQARIDDGLEFVMWVSERDDKVCSRCKKLDGNVYPTQTVPPKPHPNCRCYTVRV